MSFSVRLKRKRQKDSRIFYLRNQSLFIVVGVGVGWGWIEDFFSRGGGGRMVFRGNGSGWSPTKDKWGGGEREGGNKNITAPHVKIR